MLLSCSAFYTKRESDGRLARLCARQVGNSLWLDANAAGWGWFIDRTPRNDSEFTRRGNQGEQPSMDLLTVLEDEIGHPPGYEHENYGLIRGTPAVGERQTPDRVDLGESWWLAVLTDLSKKRDPFGWRL